jgi:hypothetical protein
MVAAAGQDRSLAGLGQAYRHPIPHRILPLAAVRRIAPIPTFNHYRWLPPPQQPPLPSGDPSSLAHRHWSANPTPSFKCEGRGCYVAAGTMRALF